MKCRRVHVADYKGFKKGNLSEALEEAIDLWIMEQAKRGKVKTNLSHRKL